MHLHTHFAVGNSNFEHVAREISGIKASTLIEVALHLKQEGRVSSLTAEQKKVFTLLSQAKTIT